MPTFAARNNISTPQQPIIDSAPQYLRWAFLELLTEYVYIEDENGFAYSSEGGMDAYADSFDEDKHELVYSYDEDTRFSGPLEIRSLVRKASIQIQEDPPEKPLPYSDWQYLSDFVLELPWYHFYSFVELVAEALDAEIKKLDRGFREGDPNGFFFGGQIILATSYEKLDEIEATVSSHCYMKRVNELFFKNNVVWMFTETGHLAKVFSKELQQLTTLVEESLPKEFESALIHYRKAQSYLLTPGSLDPENAVKEVTTSLESAGNTIFNTEESMGGILFMMKDSGLYHPLILEHYWKLWNFSNKKPGVRHGKQEIPTATPSEAELCFFIGGALLNFMLSTHGYVYR